MEADVIRVVGEVNQNGFSLISLFLQAGFVVKVVMFLLLLLSVVGWGIFFEKYFLLKRMNRLSNKFDKSFWSGQPFDQIYKTFLNKSFDPMAAIFISAMVEWKKSISLISASDSHSAVALQDRLDRTMGLTLNREVLKIEKRLFFLASIGSTAPFIGLFGTVWGIMTSFQGIALSQNTSLSVVAPGIAEALFATAMGLVAAIPAVLFYNKISMDIEKYVNRLESFSDEFSSIMSREISNHLKKSQ